MQLYTTTQSTSQESTLSKKIVAVQYKIIANMALKWAGDVS